MIRPRVRNYIIVDREDTSGLRIEACWGEPHAPIDIPRDSPLAHTVIHYDKETDQEFAVTFPESVLTYRDVMLQEHGLPGRDF